MGFNKDSIRDLRLKQGMTIEAFAQHIGASKQVVSTWETGACEPRVGSLAKIADKFGLRIDDFFLHSGKTIVSISDDATK